MFKFFLSLSVLFVLAFSSYSDTLPAFDADKITSGGELVSTIIASTDTLVDDSVVCITKGFKPSGSTVRNYVLKFPTITGGGSDSVSYGLILRSYTSLGVLMNELVEDSIKSATGKDILLHINRGFVGDNFELVLKPNGTTNGNQHIFRGLWLWSVKPID